MSNRVTLQFTKFLNVDEQGKPTREESFGYRVFDDYGQSYNNTFENMEEVAEKITKDTVLSVIQSHPEFEDLDSDTCSGVFLNDTYIERDCLDLNKVLDN